MYRCIKLSVLYLPATTVNYYNQAFRPMVQFLFDRRQKENTFIQRYAFFDTNIFDK